MRTLHKGWVRKKRFPKSRSPDDGEILTLEITDLSRGGAGVARDPDGRVVFVPYSAPGDQLRVRVLEGEKRYAQGELLEILRPSAIRQATPCPAFGRCGGCQWQHIPYEIQWRTKAAGVRHALQRTQVELPASFDELPAEKIWEYRNRIQLRGFKDRIGFYAPRSHEVIAIERCEIARPEINAAIAQTKEEGARRPRPYKVEVEVLASGELRKTWNASHAAAGFRQIHDEQNEKLKKWVAAAITPGGDLLDLFGGSGNLSLELAASMRSIDCVDVSAPAQAPEGTPANYRFHREATLAWLARQTESTSPGTDLTATGKGADEATGAATRSVCRSAILDPPREGLAQEFSEIAAHLERLGVNELVAVGCDPDAWARDISRFARRGWRLERAAALDFFPQTPHVESVGLLRRYSALSR